MFAAQLGVCSLLWLGYAFVSLKRRDALQKWAASLNPKERARQAVGRMMLSIGVLGLGMLALGLGGLTPNGLAPWAWPLTAAIGLLFVHLQTTALVPLTLNAVTRVTPPADQASESVDSHRS